MASLNKVMIIGNLGADPEVRYLDGGSVVARFNVATTERWTNKAGEKCEATEWHQVELWDAQAKVAEQYLKKGHTVHIEGKIKSEKWTDKEGVERTTVRIRGNSLIMLTAKSDSSAPAAPAQAPAKANQTVQSSAKPATAPAKPAARPAAAHPAGFENGGDDDLPF